MICSIVPRSFSRTTEKADETVTILAPGGVRRIYQPDARYPDRYFAQPGDGPRHFEGQLRDAVPERRERQILEDDVSQAAIGGNGVGAFWANLSAGRSGIAAVRGFDTSRCRTHVAGEIKGFPSRGSFNHPPRGEKASRFLWTAVSLAHLVPD